ncbi:MAG: hypothetical protein KIG36_05405 [Eubacteriales bacterium]|nr:hypothetical protein [Eubacteriales bacterium]
MKRIAFVTILVMIVSALACMFTAQADEITFETSPVIDMAAEETALGVLFDTGADGSERMSEGELDGKKALTYTGGQQNILRYNFERLGVNLTDYAYIGFRVKFEGEAKLIVELGNKNIEKNWGGMLCTEMLLVNLDGSVEEELIGSYQPTLYDFDGWLYVSTLVATWQGGAPFERALGDVIQMANPSEGNWGELEMDFTAMKWVGVALTPQDGDVVYALGDVVLANDVTPPDPNTPKIYAGTPTIDGVLDDIYLGSARIGVGGAFYAQGGADKETESQIDAATYMLHDDAHLYLCTVVTGDSYVKVLEGAGWANDAVEHYLAVNKKNYAISVDADGTAFKNASGAEAQIATTKSDNGWVIEIALPVEAVYDKLVEYGLQINDRLDDGDKLVAHGVQQYNRDFLMSADAAVAPTPAPTPTPVPATQAPTEAPTDAPTNAPTDAPATATPAPAANDGNLTWLWIVIAAVVVVAVIVVVVVLGKKKK